MSKKRVGKGFIEDIEDITQCNMYDADEAINKWFISIKTKQKEYVFDRRLSEAECNWLVEEIKNWLKQKEF